MQFIYAQQSLCNYIVKKGGKNENYNCISHDLRFMIDPRLAEGKRAEFNANFTNENISYGIALRNGVIAITAQPNKGPKLKLTKGDWSKLILGETTFASLSSGLKAFDQALGR